MRLQGKTNKNNIKQQFNSLPKYETSVTIQSIKRNSNFTTKYKRDIKTLFNIYILIGKGMYLRVGCSRITKIKCALK